MRAPSRPLWLASKAVLSTFLANGAHPHKNLENQNVVSPVIEGSLYFEDVLMSDITEEDNAIIVLTIAETFIVHQSSVHIIQVQTPGRHLMSGVIF